MSFLFAALGLAVAVLLSQYSLGLRAQSLALPTYTTAKPQADLRLRWGGKPIDGLLAESSRTMPPAAPGSLPENAYTQLRP